MRSSDDEQAARAAVISTAVCCSGVAYSPSTLPIPRPLYHTHLPVIPVNDDGRRYAFSSRRTLGRCVAVLKPGKNLNLCVVAAVGLAGRAVKQLSGRLRIATAAACCLVCAFRKLCVVGVLPLLYAAILRGRCSV